MGTAPMTARIQEFLRHRRESGLDCEACLVVDLDVVRTNYQNFAKALPDTRVFYAVKANPAPEVLSLLAGLGSCFDAASVRSEEHTSELQSRLHLVCRLLLEKKKKKK